MDRKTEQQKKEAIKMTMLMHDFTIKQQIKELHRLYHVQKKLMGELKKDSEHLPDSHNSANPQSSTDQGQLIDPARLSKEADVPLTLVDYFDLERQAPKDNVTVKDRPTASNTAGIDNLTTNDGNDGDNQVDLALSIGLGTGSSKKSQE